MAAALRHAARTLGGRALQRTQAAVAEEQRRLLPRLVHTEHPCAKPAAGPHDEGMYLVRTIQKKREELYNVIAETDRMMKRYVAGTIQEKKRQLYNLIAEADRKKMVPGRVGMQNRLLLQHLAVQIEARPNDPDWCYFRLTKRMNDFATVIYVVAFGYMVMTSPWTKSQVEKGKKITLGGTSKSSEDNILSDGEPAQYVSQV